MPKDQTIMRALVRAVGQDLGVYATVERASEVRVGDAVELLD